MMKHFATARPEQATDSCPTCAGRGIIETGEMEKGVGGWGFASVPCEDCAGTGEITSDDHERFKSEFGTDVTVSGVRRVVFFDYEGDDIFVWAFPNDKSTHGENLTEAERQSVHEQLCDWYRDWSSASPDDDRTF